MAKVFQFVGRERGQEEKTFPFRVQYEGPSGDTVSEIAHCTFSRDPGKNAFIWRPETNEDGTLASNRDIAIIEQIKKRLIPSEQEAPYVSSYVRYIEYDDIPNMTDGLGSALARMSVEDWENWIKNNSASKAILEGGLKALRMINGAPARQQAIRKELMQLQTYEASEAKGSQPPSPPEENPATTKQNAVDDILKDSDGSEQKDEPPVKEVVDKEPTPAPETGKGKKGKKSGPPASGTEINEPPVQDGEGSNPF